MKLTEVSIRKPVFAWMLMSSFILFGWLSFNELGISERPDVDFPVVNVSVEWEGAAPEVIELDILDPLESSLLTVPGIKKMNSQARRGRGDITLEFDLERDIDQAFQEVQAVLGQAQRRLPNDVEAPVVRKSNPEDRPILWLSVSSDTMTKKELMRYVRDQIRDRFQTVEGVAEVMMGGYVEPNLRIWVDEKKLAKYDLSVLDISNTVSAEHAEFPAGIFQTPATEYNVRVMGEARTIENFSNISIGTRGGRPNYQPVPLKQVVEIEDGLEDITRFSRASGKSAIGLGFRKQRGANAVDVAHAAKQKMQDIIPSLPKGVEMGVNFDSTVFIEEAIDELKMTLFLAGLLTSIVVIIFLGSWGAAFNIVLSIPTAIMATFVVLKYFGFTLNAFTMLGLSLAVGMVVDDNIMILENISRKYGETKSRFRAALEGTNEIAFAALASSTAIIAIFLPLGFVSGIIGRYFYEFAVTICAAIAFSYIDAITLTPMRTYMTLGKDKHEGKRRIDRLMSWMEEIYAKSLVWTLKYRYLVLGGTVVTLGLTYLLFNSLKREFVPAQDQGRLMLSMKTPPGSSIIYTDNKVKEIEAIIQEFPVIDRYFITVGGFSGSESNAAQGYMTLKEKAQRPITPDTGDPITQTELADQLKARFRKVQGIQTITRDPSTSGFGGGQSFPVEYALTGPDWVTLHELAEKIKKQMLDSGLMADIDSNYKGMIPELHIIPDREKALARGVSVTDIGKTIQSMISGIVVSKFAQGGRRSDIRLKIKTDVLKGPQDIAKIMVRNNRGELIPLKDVTKIETTEGLLSITREDRARAIAIYSNLAPKVVQSDALKYVQEQIIPTLPKDYAFIPTGSTKTYNESFKSLFFVLGLGIIIAYMVLAGQFNSFVHPITVLSALPFSFTGAFLALKLGGQTLNIYSMIGLILLMGIVKKNSIILVDITNQKRTEGMSIYDALLAACPIRLRPIIMTSVSTFAGTVPAALALGPGSETRIPMGLAVIGGLLFSTLLTLYLVPCLYMLIPGKVESNEEFEAR